MSLIGNTLLDKIVRVWKITNPAEILSKLNEDIQVMLRQKETNNNNGMDMSIINWEYLDNGKVKLEFAGAKNSLLYIEPNSHEMKEVKGDRKSIGGLQKSFQIFAFHEVILEKCTSIYLGSDGLEDQNNFKRKKFGRKRLIKTLCENVQQTFSAQQAIIETALETHMQGTTQRDDILWLGLKL